MASTKGWWLKLASLACASLLILLGLLVIIGWYTNTSQLVQIYPTWVPMQYNTALGFILCGLGLFGLILRLPSLSLLSSSILGFVAWVTLLEYLTGSDWGIDQFFFEHTITVKTSHPGRMAPLTALNFGLTSLAFLWVRFGKDVRLTTGGPMFLSMIIATLGLANFLGYLTGLDTFLSWDQTTLMAAHTAAGFTFVATAIVITVLVHS